MAEHPTDHDLLVKLDTKVEAMMIDLKDLRDDTRLRVSDLEHEKMDKVEAARINEELKKSIGQVEKDIRWLQKIAYSGITIVLLIQFYLQLLK